MNIGRDEASPDPSDDGLDRNAISNIVDNNNQNDSHSHSHGDKGDDSDEDGDSDAVDGPTIEAYVYLAKKACTHYFHEVEVNKTHVRSGGSMTIPTNSKRNVVSRAKDRADLVETCNLKNTFRQVIDGTFLSSICTRCQAEVGKKAIGLLGQIKGNGGISGGKEVGVEMIDWAKLMTEEVDDVLTLNVER